MASAPISTSGDAGASSPDSSPLTLRRRVPDSPDSPEAALGFDKGEISFPVGVEPSRITGAICKALGFEPEPVTTTELSASGLAATEAGEAGTRVVIKTSWEFPRTYNKILKKAALALLAEEERSSVVTAPPSVGASLRGAAAASPLVEEDALDMALLEGGRRNRPTASCCTRALNGVGAVWDRTSGLFALGYGLIFGIMAFAIVQGIDVKDPVAFGFIMAGMGILAGFSFLANFLQAYSARDVLSDVYHGVHKLMSAIMDTVSPVVSHISAGLILSAGLYFVANPAAALIGETVRRGLLGLTGSEDTGANSVDGFGAELFEQAVRALFVTKSLMTLGVVLKKRLQIMADETVSSVRRTIVDWSLPLAVGFGIAYYGLTADKDKLGLDDSPIRGMYPPGVGWDDTLMVFGSLANAAVAMKLVLGGMVSLCEEEFSGRYSTSVAFAVLACAAGVATGLATGLASSLTTEQVGSLLYNAIYATVANLSFFMDATKATKIAQLMRVQKALDQITPLFSAYPTVEAGLNAAKGRVVEKIAAARATGGFQELAAGVALPIKYLLCGREAKPPVPEVAGDAYGAT